MAHKVHSKQTTGKEKQGTAPIAEKKTVLLPVLPIFFLLVWAWAALWYGDVFRIAREYSFWAFDETLMKYETGRPWEILWMAGLLLLQAYRWPVLGGLIHSLFITCCTWLVGYNLRLSSNLRPLQYLPAMAYMSWVTYQGFDLYFETETGAIMGIPLLCLIVLAVIGIVIRTFSHKAVPAFISIPKDETPWANRIGLAIAVISVAVALALSEWLRPEVRVVTTMQRQMMAQDWTGMAETARSKADLSYRQIAAYYAIALVQKGQQGERMFDIRLDYDNPHMHGWDGKESTGLNYYQMDCDLYAGFVLSSYHHAMEHMTMNGPSIRTLKVLCKCALLRGEWEVAKKYLRILDKVPFEGEWVAKYSAMVGKTELVDKDPEFAMIRLTEPLNDTFENQYIQPVFLGYNAILSEGRSVNALWNSIMVNIYTKTMPQFIARCQPLAGTTPPQSIAEAIVLMSGKTPGLAEQFTGLEFHHNRLRNFVQDVQPLMNDRPAYARELFPKYKGYYPYYYFFGNLKATRSSDDKKQSSSNSGVN